MLIQELKDIIFDVCAFVHQWLEMKDIFPWCCIICLFTPECVMKMVQPSCIHGHHFIPKCHITETLISMKVMLSSTWLLNWTPKWPLTSTQNKTMLDISLPSQERCLHPPWQMQRTSYMPLSHPGWTTVFNPQQDIWQEHPEATVHLERHHNNPTMKSLHWLPVLFRIEDKVFFLTHSFFKHIPPLPLRSPHPPNPLKYHRDQTFSSPALGLRKPLPDNPRAQQSMDPFKWNQKSFFKKETFC